MVLAAFAGPATAQAAKARTWFVQAGPAGSAAVGTLGAPLRTLAAVEAASRAGDRIVVLPPATGTAALDGGLRLKPRQQLSGAGPAVTALAADAPSPRLTNTTTALDGDAVRLADGARVRNLRITAARRGAIYGQDVTGATVTGNDVSGHNAGCVPGFLIPPFNVPTLVTGVGVPISRGLQNGWAGIMVDATRGTTKLRVAGNHVHDADCGDGIDVRASGTATVRATIAGNDVRELREGSALQSVLAVGLQSRDRARLVARLEDNRQAGLGNDEDFGAGPSGADSEGVFVNPVGPSTLRATIVRNHYVHTKGRGGFSANGLEFVSMGHGSSALVDVRDSTFSGTSGDVLEQLALGTGATLRMRLRNVRATGSTGFSDSGYGDTVVIPGNNADCLVSASGGAGNAVDLVIRDSVLSDCANNGLTFGSSVANGTGPTRSLTLDVADSRISGNHDANLRIGNLSGLDRLAVKIERTDLGGARGAGSSPANLAVEELGSTRSAVIDLGGGALGSAGGNCLAGGTGLAAVVARYDVSAGHAWWGTPAGPPPGRTLTVAGRLDAASPLAAPPAHC